MKAGNWWVEQGLLTSGNDPTKAMSAAADQFPDEFVPMVFMTGDGHRLPPFQWVERGPWPAFFKEIVDDDKICCHVETYSDDVNIKCVPSSLAKVYLNGKVFGWEPDVFKIIQGILEAAQDLRSALQIKRKCSIGDIHFITKEMYRVCNIGYLRSEGRLAMTFWDIARSANKKEIPESSLGGFDYFLKQYNKRAMKLRTGIHPVIASRIQKRIDEFPDHIHLITCGNAHITDNPLYQYIKPPVGTFGVADENAS